jgi:hypothetical protein
VTWPAWRDGRRITEKGPVLHAVTDERTGHTWQSGFRALCGRPVRYKVEDVFDPDDPQSCPDCAIEAVIRQQQEGTEP